MYEMGKGLQLGIFTVCSCVTFQLSANPFDYIEVKVKLLEKAKDVHSTYQHAFYHTLFIMKIGIFSQNLTHPVSIFFCC